MSTIKTNRRRSETIIGTIEKKYGRDFGARSNKRIADYLKEKGYGSLTELLRSRDGKAKHKTQ